MIPSTSGRYEATGYGRQVSMTNINSEENLEYSCSILATKK